MTKQLIEYFEKQNVKLWLENGKLHIRAPEDLLTPPIKEQLKIHKDEIITFLTSQADQEPILSYNQKAMLSLYELDPKSVAYNVSYTAKLRSDVNLTILQNSYRSLIQKHQILKTVYPTQNENTTLRILQEISPFPVKQVHDWQDEDIQNWTQEQANIPFDLKNGPILRAHVLQNTNSGSLNTENYFFFVIHHIAGDFGSLNLILDEIERFYEAELEEITLPYVQETTYQDFARIETKKITQSHLESLWNYWKNSLKGELPIINLPITRPRPQVQTFNGRVYKRELSLELSQKLKQVSKEEKITPFVFSLAVFQLLLNIYTNQNDILIGTPTTLRNKPGLEKAIGNFVNPVVLRANLSEDIYFKDFLLRVRENVIGALDHNELPFSLLVSNLFQNRDLSRSPIFQVMFIWNKEHKKRQGESLFADTYIALQQQGAAYEIVLTITENQESLICEWCYNIDLFSADEIEKIATHYENLLRDVLLKPQNKISEFSCLTPEERQLILYDWNRTTKDYPKHLCIHQLFEQQVEKTPDAVAAIFEDESVTYRELNARSNRIAHQLMEMIDPEDIVGIYTERHINMLAAMIGILKAGGAYLPMDYKYPKERLEYMLRDSQAKFVITEKAFDNHLSCHKVFLEELLNKKLSASTVNPICLTTPSHLSYVFYTSGSTGLPKGVMIEHRNSVAFICWGREFFSKEELSYTLASTSICFDLSVFELFTPISSGGAVVIVDSPLKIADSPPKNLSLINTVPSAIKILTKIKGIPHTVQTVSLCGEALTKDVADRIYEVKNIKSVVNLYGPTEDTTYSTFCRLKKGYPFAPPIGKSIDNSQTYVLDRFLRPVPVGVMGELYLGGAGLARGYLNRPELTNEKFIPHPFELNSEKRIYRTGDFVRYLSDGTLDYLGRIDHQIKINGYRVELEEIEATLKAINEIDDAVVLVQKDEMDNQKLVAFLIGKPNQELLSPTTLKQKLSLKLATYMIPNSFVYLDAFPLTSNGKIDRKLFPNHVHTNTSNKTETPQTHHQQAMCDIWKQVLGIQNVSIHDNFFAIGGHSLIAGQLIAKIRTMFNLEVPFKWIYEAQTIAQLVELIEQLKASQTVEECPQKISKISRDQKIPLSDTQHSLWFLSKLQKDNVSYNIPIIMEITGSIDPLILEKSLQMLTERHEALRTKIVSIDSTPSQKIQNNPSVILEIMGCRLEEVDAIIEKNVKKPFLFDSNEFLVRFLLLTVEPNKSFFILNVHHIICDAWSLNIFVKELFQCYKAIRNGSFPKLPELSIQYIDYIYWQKQFINTIKVQKGLDYWKKALANSPQLLSLPIDHQRPPIQSFKGQLYSFTIPNENFRSLLLFAKQMNTTPFVALLSAFKILLSHYSGSTDIPVGTGVANRNRTELEGVIGDFVNTLVLRSQIDPRISYLQLLEKVKNVSINAFINQDVPFIDVLRILYPERNLTYNPLFQVWFLLNENYFQPKKLDDLTIKFKRIDLNSARFDLAFEVTLTDEGLVCDIEYSTDLFELESIKMLGRHYQTLLEEISKRPHANIQDLKYITPNELHSFASKRKNSLILSTKSIQQITSEYPSPEELIVAEIWKELLNTQENIGIHDNFFTLGGDSLIASHLIAKIRNQFSVELPFKTIYEAQTIHQLVEKIQFLKNNQTAEDQLQAIIPIERNQDLALSINQQSLWFLSQIQKDNISYNIPLVIEISGSLDSINLNKSLQILIERHESLRTRVISTNSNPLQKIENSFLTNLQIIHCKIEDINAIIEENVKKPFRFGLDEFLVRFMLLSVEPNSNFLILNFHHIISDAWSINIFVKELFQCYKALKEGSSLNLPELSIQYVDYAYWQKQFLNTAKAKDEINYWKTSLTDSPPLLHLPLDHPRPSEQSFKGQLYSFTIPSESFSPLLNFAKQMQTTPFVALLSAFKILLSHYSGSTDIPVGTGVANRNRTELYGIIGNFVNTVVLRSQVDPKISYMQLLEGVTSTSVNAFANQNIPFMQVLRALYPERHLTYNPLFQVWFLLNENYFQPKKLDDLTIKFKRIDLNSARFDLAFEVTLTDQGLICDIEYSTDLFELETIKMLGRHYQTLLEEISKYPHAKIEELQYIAPDDLHILFIKRMRSLDLLPKPIQSTVSEHESPEELLVAEIWKDLLNIQENIGIHENFFNLGGDSLIASHLIAKIRNQFSVELPFKTIYEAQTIHQLVEKIQFFKKNQSAEDLLQTIIPLERNQDLALSVNQQSLWFLSQIQEDNISYNIPLVLEISGPFDLKIFTESLGIIIRRHELLRTKIITKDSHPLQKIENDAPDILESISCSIEDIHSIIEQKTAQSFEIDNNFLYQIMLLTTDVKNRHFLLLKFHHLICDAWSINIFVNDLFQCYKASKDKIPLNLPNLNIQYADYANWQREFLKTKRAQEQMNFWLNNLANLPVHLSLPLDFERPSIHRFKGDLFAFSISNNFKEQIFLISKELNTTPFVTLLTIFKILLFQYTNFSDIPVGTAVANRNHTELHHIFGNFVNTVVLRSNVDSKLSFKQLMKHVASVSAEAFANQDLPFEEVVNILQPTRSLMYNPLFQVWFALHEDYFETKKLANMSIDFHHLNKKTARFDLAFEVIPTKNDLSCAIEYNTDLFTSETIRNFGKHYQALLMAVIKNPDTKIEDLQYISPDDLKVIAFKRENSNNSQSTQVFEDSSFQFTSSELLIANIWKECLNIKEIHPNDNFFEKGGNSLLSVQVCWRIRETLGIRVSIRTLFEQPVLKNFIKAIKPL